MLLVDAATEVAGAVAFLAVAWALLGRRRAGAAPSAPAGPARGA
jgi:hypothetical protein